MDVLIVDDNEDIASLLEAVLTDSGHTVRLARDGEDGLARLAERLPEVMLMDVEMPVLDGPGMAARMLLEDAGKEMVPIVIMSGAENLARIASRVGTPYFLPKPSAPHDILLMLQRALAERRAPTPLLDPPSGPAP
jgi:CheY-like chemotaxis protein